MDENVVFQNNQAPDNAPVQQTPPADISGQPPMSQPPPTTGDALPPQTPPPAPPTSFLSSSLFKKILIGGGIVFFLILLLILFIPKGNPNKHVTLLWWGLWEDPTVMQRIISDFERQNPNITVEYVKQDPNQYRDRLLARINNGNQPPDIFMYHNTWLPMMSDNLVPFPTSVISSDDFKKIYYPVMQQDLTKNGAIYGIPQGGDTLSMFVNTQLFKNTGTQVPQTWEDFEKAAVKLTVPDDSGHIKTAGAAMGTYGNITHAPDILSMLFAQNGTDLHKFSTTSKPASANKIEDTPGGGALTYYLRFSQSEHIWDNTLDESALMFARGNLAMYFGYSWDIFRIQALNKDLQFKVYEVPNLFGNKTTIASYWVNGVSSKSPNQKEALLFMHYLAQKDTAQKLYEDMAKSRGAGQAFGEPYARKDLASTIQPTDLVYPFVHQLNGATSTYFSSDTNDGEAGLNSVANTYLENLINSVTNDNTSLDTALDTLNQGVNQLYQKYGIQ